jgi:hypothetical protein
MKPVSIYNVYGYMVHASHVEFMETYHFSRIVAASDDSRMYQLNR